MELMGGHELDAAMLIWFYQPTNSALNRQAYSLLIKRKVDATSVNLNTIKCETKKTTGTRKIFTGKK